MDRHCNGCNTTKPITEFNKKTFRCKTCCRAYTAKWRARRPKELKQAIARKEYLDNKQRWADKQNSTKDGNQHVYVLPKENYAGVTCNPPVRMANHRSTGRYTGDMRILYSTPDRDEALELEGLLHDEGYEGRHLGHHRSFK